jgi:hypothetical protein
MVYRVNILGPAEDDVEQLVSYIRAIHIVFDSKRDFRSLLYHRIIRNDDTG